MEEVQIGGIEKSVAAATTREEGEEESLKQMFRQLKAIKPGQTAASFATAAAAGHIVAAVTGKLAIARFVA